MKNCELCEKCTPIQDFDIQYCFTFDVCYIADGGILLVERKNSYLIDLTNKPIFVKSDLSIWQVLDMRFIKNYVISVIREYYVKVAFQLLIFLVIKFRSLLMVMFCMPQKLVDLADKVLAIIQDIHNGKGYPYELKIEQKDDGLSVKLDRKVVVKLRWAGNEAVRLGLSPVIAYSCPPGWDKDSLKGKPFYTFNVDQNTVNDPALKEAIQDAWLEYQVVSSSPSFYMVLQEVCKKFAFKLDTTIWYLETDTILGEEENPQISYIDALGKYSPQKQEVSLDIEMIERVACCLNIPFENLKKIAQVFQAAKVIIHLGRDIDGYVGFWDEDVPQFVEKESIISTFAMYMTYTFFSNNGTALEHFKKYAILLPKEMQKWQLLESVGMEKMRHFLLIFRQRDLLLDSDTLFQLVT